MDAGKLDRLKFDQQRITAAAQGVRHVASLPDPIGEIVRGYHLENGVAPSRPYWSTVAIMLWSYPCLVSTSAMTASVAALVCSAACPPRSRSYADTIWKTAYDCSIFGSLVARRDAISSVEAGDQWIWSSPG